MTENKDNKPVRPFVTFTPDEYKRVSMYALELDMGKSEFLHDCVMYIVNNKIDIKA